MRKVRRAKSLIRVEISLWFRSHESRTVDSFSCLLGQTAVLIVALIITEINIFLRCVSPSVEFDARIYEIDRSRFSTFVAFKDTIMGTSGKIACDFCMERISRSWRECKVLSLKSVSVI